jgi:hypothetical protein
MNNPDHVSESFETISWVKILKFFECGSGNRNGNNSDPGWKKFESGIRDKNSGSATLLTRKERGWGGVSGEGGR